MLKSKNLLITLISLLIALILAEIYLHFNPPIPVYIETRNIVQHTHSVPSSNVYLGYVPESNLAKPFKNHEFHVVIKTNSKGMRDREHTFEKKSGIRRIAVLGDSFVFGWGVENDEIFTEILENSFLPHIEVLNFGVSGYAAYQEMERLKQDALPFHPDIVLFFVYGLPEGYPEKGDSYILRDGFLYRADFPPPTLKQKIGAFARRNFYLYTLVREWLSQLQGESMVSAPLQKRELEKGFQLLNTYKTLSTENHFLPVVIFIPTKQSAKEGQDSQASLVEAYCQKINLPFLDLTQALHQSWIQIKKSPYFKLDDHWNKNGHQVVAETLAHFLKTLLHLHDS